MHIAREKIKSNIGEYFLYMFQIEDLIRACQFEPKTIEEKLVSRYPANGTALSDIKQWYLGLTELMKDEKLETKGHMQFLLNKIAEVYEFHLYLIETNEDTEYNQRYLAIEQIIADLQSKNTESINPLLLVLNSVYGYVLLKMKKHEISASTQTAINQLVSWLNILSLKFKDYEKGDIQIEK